MRDLKYLIAYLSPVVVFLSLYIQGPFVFFAPVVLFVFVPILEIFLPVVKKNLTSVQENSYKSRKFFDFLLYLNVPIQFLLLYYFLTLISSSSFNLLESIGLTMSMGMACGVMGINVAHELGHRLKPVERLMSKSLLLTSLYMHFFIEHNRGHHKNVATLKDPATSRLGETVYTFWFRSIFNSYLSAWRIENNRMRKIGKSIFSIQNEMILFQVIQLLFIALIIYFFGWVAGIAFIGASAVGYLLLETVNYIEHYGLLRKEKSPGQYERVQPHHSWNADHITGRIMLDELTRHSDHHYLASRKYQILRHFDEAPQLPTGYPGMMMMSFLPPLYFYIMDRRIEQLSIYKEMYAEEDFYHRGNWLGKLILTTDELIWEIYGLYRERGIKTAALTGVERVRSLLHL